MPIPSSFGSSAPEPDRHSFWFVILLTVGLWLLARPYLGVRHDGVLYMGQALLHLNAGAMQQDLFFQFGSQDQFSVFSKLLAYLYRTLGVASAQPLVLACCHLPFLLACAWLTRDFGPLSVRAMGLAVMTVFSHFYGGFGIFGFAESFVTARTMAEPVVVLALAALVHGRPGWAAVLGALAAMAHPLVTLPFFVVAWLFLCLNDRRWWWALVPVLLGLAAASALPARLNPWVAFDPVWFEMVQDNSPHVFVGLWQAVDWYVLALDLAVLAAAQRSLPVPLARLCRATGIASMVLLLVAGVGADLLHSVLLTGLQVWRVLWIAHLLALLCMPLVFTPLWRQGPEGRLQALAWALAALAINAAWAQSWVFVLWALLMHHACRRPPGLAPRMTRLALGATALTMLGLSAAIAASRLRALELAGSRFDSGLLWVATTLPSLSLPLVAALLLAWTTGRRALALGCALILVLAGGLNWDRRSDWIRHLEAAPVGHHPFAALIPPHAQVYWPDNLPATCWAGPAIFPSTRAPACCSTARRP